MGGWHHRLKDPSLRQVLQRGAKAEDMGEACLRNPPEGPALFQSESLDQMAGPKLILPFWSQI